MYNQINSMRPLHPCFNSEARDRFGRIHLPVALRCNIQCNYCNRKYDCINESRPGVTSSLLTPDQALHYLQRILPRHPEITVVGIAGPGDPFANPPETLETIELVNRNFPELLICLATNGLNLLPHIGRLTQFKVSHVTVTINAVDPEIGQLIYPWVREREIFRGLKAAKFLLERQLAAISALKGQGFIVKVNSIIIPGVNDRHIPEIAAKMAELKVDTMNCVPLFPAKDTLFESIAEPSPGQVKLIRQAAGQYLPQMEHCRRCRADAAGLLTDSNSNESSQLLAEIARGPLKPLEERPCIAVASWEGLLINQHLGEAAALAIYRQENGCYQFLEIRPIPAPGGSHNRWMELARILHDCHSILVNEAGQSPRETLTNQGIKVIVADGLIEEALNDISQDITPRQPCRQKTGCGINCKGDGLGCG